MLTDQHLEDLVRREHDQYPEPDSSLLARIALLTYASDPADRETPSAAVAADDDIPVFDTEERGLAKGPPRFRSKQLLLGLALLAPLVVAVGVVVGRRTEPNVRTVGVPPATSTSSQQASRATLTPDLTASFPALEGAPSISSPPQVAAIARLREQFRIQRPDLKLSDPAGWIIGAAGDADYALVSFGPDRLCLVGFRHDGAINGPACAAAQVAESPASPLTIFGPLEQGRGAIAVLAPTGIRSVALRTEQGSVDAPIAGALAYAASPQPAVSFTVTTNDGRSVRTPLAADSGTGAAFALSVQESVRRDQLAVAAGDLDQALRVATGFAGLSIDYWQDRLIRVGVDEHASAGEQAEMRAIVARFPKLAPDVEFVTRRASSGNLEVLMRDVERAWGNDPSFVSIGIGDGVIDITHLTGLPLPAAVQAIIDQQPDAFRVTESAGYVESDLTTSGPTEGLTAPTTSVSVQPRAGGTNTVIVVSFKARVAAGVVGDTRYAYRARVRSAPADGCVQDDDMGFGDQVGVGSIASVRLDPGKSPGGHWCKGIFHGTVVFTSGFACPDKGTCHPPAGSHSESLEIGRFSFEIR